MRGLASLLTVTRAEWGTGRSPRERGQQVPPLPGNGMWTRPQRRSGWPSPHVVSRALVCGIPGWCLAERPACPASCAPQCVYRAAHPVGLLEFASVISQVEDQGHSSQGLTEVGPRPYLTGLVSIPAGRGLISLPGVGVSSLDFLIPTSLLLFCPK